MLQRRHVSNCEVLDVDVVTDARAIGCRIVRAEHLDLAALAERCLAGDLDEVGGAWRRLAGAALGEKLGSGCGDPCRLDLRK